MYFVVDCIFINIAKNPNLIVDEVPTEIAMSIEVYG